MSSQTSLQTLSDGPPAVTAALDDLTTSVEPLANTDIRNGLNNSLDEAEEQPDSAVISCTPAPSATLVEPSAGFGLNEPEEQPIRFYFGYHSTISCETH